MLNNIAERTGLSVEDVAFYMDDVVAAIRGYTNKLFLTRTHVGGKFVIKDGVLTSEIKLQGFNQGDTIELYNSDNNPTTYVVKDVTEHTLKVYGTLQDDEFIGYVIKIVLTCPQSIIINMMNYRKVTSEKIGIKSEKLDDYSYVLNTDAKEIYNGYPISIMSTLQRQMPGNESREYKRAGLPIRQPLYR